MFWFCYKSWDGQVVSSGDSHMLTILLAIINFISESLSSTPRVHVHSGESVHQLFCSHHVQCVNHDLGSVCVCVFLILLGDGYEQQWVFWMRSLRTLGEKLPQCRAWPWAGQRSRERWGLALNVRMGLWMDSVFICVYSADLFCYRCGEQGHIARDCEQTEDGETMTTPH